MLTCLHCLTNYTCIARKTESRFFIRRTFVFFWCHFFPCSFFLCKFAGLFTFLEQKTYFCLNYTVLPLIVHHNVFLLFFLSPCSSVPGRLGYRLCAGGILFAEFHIQPRLRRLYVQAERQTSQSTSKNYETTKPFQTSCTQSNSVNMNKRCIVAGLLGNLICSHVNANNHDKLLKEGLKTLSVKQFTNHTRKWLNFYQNPTTFIIWNHNTFYPL